MSVSILGTILLDPLFQVREDKCFQNKRGTFVNVVTDSWGA